jgi:outer membrane biosynthesis protein TonB
MSKLKEILKDKDRRRGIIGTTIVHLLLIVALLFLALRTPLPLPGEEGVEVNLGYDEQGYGDIQSETPPPISNPTPPPPQEQQPVIEEPEPEIIEEEIITQDVEEAPVIEEEVIAEKPDEPEKEPEEIIEEKPEPEPEKEIIEEEPEKQPVDSTFITESEEIIEEPVEEPKPVVNTRALYPGTSKTSADGTNQGIKPGTGDMGKPEGYKESEKYDGRGGQGDGPSYGLGGRGKILLDEPPTQFDEIGEIKVTIFVDRDGKVVDARIDYSGTNIIDQKQRQQAIDAALNSKFERDPNAPERDRGWITYKFIK